MLFLNLDDHLVEHVLGHLVVLEVGKEGTEAEGGRNIFWIDRSNPGPEAEIFPQFLTWTSSVTNLESSVITTSVTLSLSLQVVYTMSLSCGQVNTTTTGATER